MKKHTVMLLCLLLALLLADIPHAVAASPGQAEEKRVRVGWFDSSYNSMDASGRRSGYSYEYQLKLACYTGWTYEYVSGSWPELMEMLEKGEIDLMSDVSYTEERAERMLFASYPMGTEEYYVFAAPGSREIWPDDAASLNGKRVGVNKGSIQAAFYRDWAQRNGVQSELIEVVCSEEESLTMMENGELDAYVTVDAFSDPKRAFPVCKVGSSDFFFVVSRERPELLAELNSALGRIQEGDRYFNQQLFDKYIKRAGANAFLTAEEAAWLEAHGIPLVLEKDGVG